MAHDGQASVSGPAIDTPGTPAGLDRLLGELRPKLHRYCARMTGSVIDGEDVVQEALVKVIEAFPRAGSITHLEAWLFRITHNAALDFLRRRARHNAALSDEDPDTMVDPVNAADDRQVAAVSLRTFMRLPVAQRSSVILMDVLGYSLDEIRDVIDSSIPAVKAALHRGRARLRELAREPEDVARPVLAEPERSLLATYVDRFNARDFDAIRDMLAAEVRLELVNKVRLNGRRDVGTYFHNYGRTEDWHLVLGLVEGRPAVLVHAPDDPAARPTYFVLVAWDGDRIVTIRDFRYARYVTEDAEISVPV
jgi:RNA polymerase sigma-70 factor (ECF subfamily)